MVSNRSLSSYYDGAIDDSTNALHGLRSRSMRGGSKRRQRFSPTQQQQPQHNTCSLQGDIMMINDSKSTTIRCSRGQLITAAIALLTLGPRTGCEASMIGNGRMYITEGDTTTSPPRQQQRSRRHHEYDPLNITMIEFSPLLSSRYRWLRQSSTLGRLIDEEIHNKYNNYVVKEEDVHMYNNNIDWSGTVRDEQQQAKDENLVDKYNNQRNSVDGNDDDDDNGKLEKEVAPSAQQGRHHRRLANDDAVAADDYVYNYNNNNNAAATPIPTPSPTVAPTPDAICYSKSCTVNEQCTKFLFGFLQGTTDAKDNCEGIMNAYVAADCGAINKASTVSTDTSSLSYSVDDDFNDDYFGVFYDHQCCASLRSHYYEYCDESGTLNGQTLLVVAAVMLLCECAKSIVKKNRIRWLPEAAACMLVGMSVALGARVFGTNIENIGFDEEIFMYLLLPPIIFEAALTVNKQEFRRRRGSIMVFAVFGTLLSSFITGAAVYYSAKYFGQVQLSVLDSLVFGSLISSIDPVAILSVLTSLKMSETDTIYILVLGESLLNDGIAITLFKSLVQQYNSAGSAVTIDDILGSVADFLIISFGSIAIGLTCGVACLCYFHLNSSIMNPVMEVASFFLWAVVPYWMSEVFEWSGIVAIVVMGFFMDIYLRPGWDPASLALEEQHRQLLIAQSMTVIESPHRAFSPRIGPGGQLEYYNWDDDNPNRFRFRGTAVDLPTPNLLARRIASKQQPPQPPPIASEINDEEEGGNSNNPKHKKANSLFIDDNNDSNEADISDTTTTNPNIRAILMKREFVRLSCEADEHVRFVAHILSSLSENAIFAYLGLFIFSSKYKWDAVLCSIGVTSCIVSRAIMVVISSWFIWYMHVYRQRAGCHSKSALSCVEEDSEPTGSSGESDPNSPQKNPSVDPLQTPISKSARALSNYKVQVVLILAGLRGAVSLALVENIPIYNGVTGIGSKNKPLIKAMTSSSIIFTIFVLGGGAYYILKWLDISSDDMLIKSHGTTEAYNSNFPYLAPQMVCGANVQAEMELPDRKLSWRSSHSPHEHSFNQSPSPCPSPRIRSPRGRIPATSLLPQSFFMSPSLVRSRSDWSTYTGSTTNAELNYVPFLSNDKNVRETSSFPDYA